MRLSKRQATIMYTLWRNWKREKIYSVAVDELAKGLYGWWCLYRLDSKGLIKVFMGPGKREHIRMSDLGVNYCAHAEMWAGIQEMKRVEAE